MPNTNIYRWQWTDKPSNALYKDTYRLEMFSADNTTEMPSEPEIVNMDIKSLDNFLYKTENPKFLFGRENAPVFNIDLELKYLSNEYKSLQKEYPLDYDIYIPFSYDEGYEVSLYLPSVLRKNVISSHIWSLYVNDNLVWLGIQVSTIEGNLKDGILTIEIHAIPKIVTSAMTMNDCVYLALLSDTDYIRVKQCAYDMIFKDSVKNGSSTNTKTVAYGAVTTGADYFYYIRKSKLNELLNYIYKSIAVAITRNYFNDTIFNNAIPEITNTTYYKQNYQSILARGDALNENDLYFLGFICQGDLTTRTGVDWRIRVGFYEKLDTFDNVWDYLGIIAQENMIRMICNTSTFKYEKIFEGGILIGNNDLRKIDDGDLNIDAEILERTEASCVEKYQKDVDRIEYIGYGNRSQNSDNLTTIFNQNYSLRDNKVYQNAVNLNVPLADRFRLTGTQQSNCIVFHNTPEFLKYYYWERPDNGGYMTIEEVPISANHNVKISFNSDNSFTSDEFSTIKTTDFDFTSLDWNYFGKDALFDGLNRLHKSAAGKLYCIAKSYSMLMNGRVKRQIEYENTFDKISSYQSGLSIVNTFSNAFLTAKLRRFRFDFASLDSFLDTVNTDGFVIDNEMDLTCKDETTGFRVTSKYKILVTNYE